MDCTGDVSALRSSVDCDGMAQFWKGSLCFSCCKCKMLVVRVLKLSSLSVVPFCHASALPSWPLLSSSLCAPCGSSCCCLLRLFPRSPGGLHVSFADVLVMEYWAANWPQAWHQLTVEDILWQAAVFCVPTVVKLAQVSLGEHCECAWDAHTLEDIGVRHFCHEMPRMRGGDNIYIAHVLGLSSFLPVLIEVLLEVVQESGPGAL